jgi:cleavage and polyadenylation specificity factor subunit 1
MQNFSVRHEFAAKALCNLVVARSNLLRIFEVRQGAGPITPGPEKAQNGAEDVPGEVEMDSQGEGFVNIAKARFKVRSR